MSNPNHTIYKFGLFTASAFVIANMIGTGVFTSLGFLLESTTNFVTIMLLWLFGGVIALCGALVYGELGSVMPRSGGEYHYLREIYHPIIGFMSGWASLIVGFAAPVALACMALARYLFMVYPVFTPTTIALIMLILITGLHAYDVKTGGAVQRYFTLFKILAILLFIVCGFFLPERYQDVSPSFSAFSFDELFSTGFAVSLIWVYYSYSGWNASAYMAGEIKNPQKTIPQSLLISTLIVTILYVLLNAVFLLAAPVNELTGQIEVGFIAAQYIFGEGISHVVAVVIALLLLSSISSMVFLAPRVSQVMGEDTYILRPLSRRSKQGTPYVAIWVQFTISALLIITDSFELVTKYTGITLSFFALLAVFGVFVHRKRYPNIVRPYKTWGYPVTPCIFIALISWSIVYLIHEDYSRTFITQTQDAMWMSLMSLVTLLTGAGVYLLNKLIVKYKKNTR
ncbi:amino acid permease [Bacteroides sp. OttesenSCG-928-J23]|nr:amino acid permease [Bacteroides sp. OttesenSCG-928-N06]MDL2247280.1 amino acid permease [Bacteroides sp. OttesenSCG-928-J23]MDL2299386.1 amino acid permease [Bacteroides sp. OttesenSCG-928-E20]MDL2305055.1 amino acid permease [Bacteroides sp. OttesenSCG-928-D19]